MLGKVLKLGPTNQQKILFCLGKEVYGIISCKRAGRPYAYFWWSVPMYHKARNVLAIISWLLHCINRPHNYFGDSQNNLIAPARLWSEYWQLPKIISQKIFIKSKTTDEPIDSIRYSILAFLSWMLFVEIFPQQLLCILRLKIIYLHTNHANDATFVPQ